MHSGQIRELPANEGNSSPAQETSFTTYVYVWSQMKFCFVVRACYNAIANCNEVSS